MSANLGAASQSCQDIRSFLISWLGWSRFSRPILTADFGRWSGCFLSALLLSLTPAGATVVAGESSGLASEFILFMPTLLPLAKPALDALSVRRSNRPAHLQCLGLP